jgi:hypothetical protein
MSDKYEGDSEILARRTTHHQTSLSENGIGEIGKRKMIEDAYGRFPVGKV